ncbi:MAG: hypothetical protein OXQ29_07800 [Rhodospirillaceae bacterium]|nr:hypothetical protein [Rhodospirillaceae bacterium]
MDLLLTSLDPISVQDRVAAVPPAARKAGIPANRLEGALESSLGDYDLVIVDRPPNFGILLCDLGEELRRLDDRLRAFDDRIEAVARAEPSCRSLESIPQIGPLTATAP